MEKLKKSIIDYFVKSTKDDVTLNNYLARCRTQLSLYACNLPLLLCNRQDNQGPSGAEKEEDEAGEDHAGGQCQEGEKREGEKREGEKREEEAEEDQEVIS